MDQTLSIRVLLPAIEEAAQLARSYYRHHDRLGTEVKWDQSVVTAADRAIEALLRQAIAQHFPGCNLVGEEDKPDYDPSRPYTFIIDPIDGTMPFVNDTPSWAICIGVLDRACTPVAGILCAPAWDSLYLADFDPASPALLNDRPLPRVTQAPSIDSDTTLLVDSKLFRTHYLHGFTGRCRGFGSIALPNLPGSSAKGLCHGSFRQVIRLGYCRGPRHCPSGGSHDAIHRRHAPGLRSFSAGQADLELCGDGPSCHS
ncbi:MAG: hypothetical protein ETSY2_30775 [Candidatus Entotheonella gemina]|uniref:Inositol monophosphatase n=1 Tax=Candidatus Entotheonella gemina TaxID=1429439 RepID=W4M373_9BACT|nr:MAG: hypothetical protein ETSY2_30775 [Candidatus Entotheonella gemina]